MNMKNLDRVKKHLIMYRIYMGKIRKEGRDSAFQILCIVGKCTIWTYTEPLEQMNIVCISRFSKELTLKKYFYVPVAYMLYT